MDSKLYVKTIELIGSYGFRFTTDDLARELAASKRTLYSIFSSKEELLEKTLDYIFTEQIQSDLQIQNDSSLTLAEKLEKTLSNTPTAYNIGCILRHLDELKRTYPLVWEKANNMLDQLWDTTVTLVVQGMETKQIHTIDVSILRVMLSETTKKLFDYDYLIKNRMSFEDALQEMNQILLYGLLKQ